MVSDHQRLEGKWRVPGQVIEVDAEGVGSQLGLDAGDRAHSVLASVCSMAN